MEQTSFSCVVRVSWFKSVTENKCRRMSQNFLSLLSEKLKAHCFYVLIFQVKCCSNSSGVSTLQVKTQILSHSFFLTMNSGFGGRKGREKLPVDVQESDLRNKL